MTATLYYFAALAVTMLWLTFPPSLIFAFQHSGWLMFVFATNLDAMTNAYIIRSSGVKRFQITRSRK
jgi:hypothetical protein